MERPGTIHRPSPTCGRAARCEVCRSLQRTGCWGIYDVSSIVSQDPDLVVALTRIAELFYDSKVAA